MAYSLSRHRRAQCVVTVGVLLAVITHYVFEFFFPGLVRYAPLAGAGASLLWVWIE